MKARDCDGTACGLPYVRWDPSNVQQHRWHHDEWENGVCWAEKYHVDVIERGRDDSIITEVTPDSNRPLRLRVWRLAVLANREMRYDGAMFHPEERPSPTDCRMLVYHRGDRGLGFCRLDRMADPHLYRWSHQLTPALRWTVVNAAPPGSIRAFRRPWGSILAKGAHLSPTRRQRRVP